MGRSCNNIGFPSAFLHAGSESFSLYLDLFGNNDDRYDCDNDLELSISFDSVMKSIKLHSYAKVNLTLEVSAKREDGYHDIDSVVQIIDINDELNISRADTGVIEVITDTAGVPSGRYNLVYRAFEAFIDAVGIRGGVKCDLRKNIPPQAGLGGGSGDAAAAIVGLNQLYECGLSAERLAEIGAKIGSDVPLFIYGGTVRMRGRGELVEPLPDAPELHLVVLKPDVGVSTAWAYLELDKSAARTISVTSDNMEGAVHAHDRDTLIRSLSNDFDPVVSDAVIEVREAKKALIECGAEAAMLAGSGSAVFGIFGSKYNAESAAVKLSESFKEVFVTRTLRRSESSLS